MFDKCSLLLLLNRKKSSNSACDSNVNIFQIDREFISMLFYSKKFSNSTINIYCYVIGYNCFSKPRLLLIAK